MPAEAELSIIIASRNSWVFLGSCIRSIYQFCSLTCEIIVVDNASSDRTVENLRNIFPAVHVIVLTENRGHCYAINRGLKAATGAFLMVLDADTIMEAGAVDRQVECLRANSDYAVVAPRMLDPDGSIQPTARNFPRAINGLFGRQSLLTRFIPGNPFSRQYLRIEDSARSSVFEVEWVSAACMVFPRRVIETIGYWDEGFTGYWVDADWCRRARACGPIVCEPSARVVHYEQNRRGVRRGASRIVSFHAGVNRFYRKHYTFGYLDPRAVICAAALSIRALLLLLVDQFLPDPLQPADAPVAPRLRAAEVASTETPNEHDRRKTRY